MKKLALILVCTLFWVMNLYSQQGTQVRYQEIMTLDLPVPEHLPEELRNQIPDQRIFYFDLFYKGDEALFTNAQDMDNADLDISSGDENESFQFRIEAPRFTVYTHRGKNQHLASQNFMDRAFLIDDDCLQSDWKITSEQRTVLDIPCIKATSTNGITAWFAPSIKSSHGPKGYGGLPGLILAMEFPEDKREIIAQSIVSTNVNTAEWDKPKRGKKVDRKEFDEIVEKKMQEMGADGEGGMRIIMIEEEN